MSSFVSSKSASDSGLKPTKISRSDLYKPPTIEELTNLQETEMLFHSNLIRLQITETLKEISLPEKRRNKIDEFLHQLHDEIMKIPETPVAPLENLSWLEARVCYPFINEPKALEGNMCYLPPSKITVIGSYQIDTGLKQQSDVDLLLVMPTKCTNTRDYLNQLYLRKRAAYIAHVAHHLSNSNLLSNVEFSYFLDNPLKPIILLNPSGKLASIVTIRIHVCPSEEILKSSRFHPVRNNVRQHWYNGEQPSQSADLTPTPQYNSTILMDLQMEEHLRFLNNLSSEFQAFKDAVKLLKIWLKQRELDQGYGCFNGFIMSMLIAQLVLSKKISKMMSSYQIVRNVFNDLATTDWTHSGLHFGRVLKEDLKVFHEHFEVVFLERSGILNLCANMSAVLYKQVCHEAQLSLEALDMKQCGFNVVFMEPVPFVRKFDSLLYFSNVGDFQKTCEKETLKDRMIDHAGNCLSTSLPLISSMILKGLGDKIHLLGIRPHRYMSWKINQPPPSWQDVEHCFSFGLLLDTHHSTDILNKGPSADTPEAVTFRNFWGDLSELRRFKDSSICEAVVWNSNSTSDKREIPARICRHLLQRHCDIPETSVLAVSTQFDQLLTLPPRQLSNGSLVGYSGIGDEIQMKVIHTFNELCTQLQALKSLPLTISKIQGLSATLRRTEVFPPTQCQVEMNLPAVSVNNESVQLPLPNQECPQFVLPIEANCVMTKSSKWPTDPKALSRLKAAFHVAISEELKSIDKTLVCIPSQTHFLVLKNGFVFKMCVVYQLEISALETQTSPDGMVKFRKTPKSLALEKQTVHLPFVASIMHGLEQRCLRFGETCRLAKLWVSSHLLCGHISAEAIELICAQTFTSTQPYTEPGSGQTGFLRFLYFLSSFDFSSNPLIVDVNKQLQDSDYESITSHFNENRNALPAMCIMTSHDRRRSVWTTDGPNSMMLRRLKSLAQMSLGSLEAKLLSGESQLNMKQAFLPSLQAYDVVIHLKSQWVPRRHQSLSNASEKAAGKLLDRSRCESVSVLPVVNFDPVEIYVKELEDSFGEFALFFHDMYGGSVVGVLWKPQSFEPRPFKIAAASCRIMSNEKSVPNVQAIIEDFKSIGAGFVQSIDARTHKWNI